MNEEEKKNISDSTMDMTCKELLAYILGLIENDEPFPKKRVRSLIIRFFIKSSSPKKPRSAF